MIAKSSDVETRGPERFLSFRQQHGEAQAGGAAASPRETPEEGVAVWTTYGGGVYECEVWVAEEAEGGFSACAAQLPGVVAQAEDIDRVLYEIQRALSATIASYITRGEDVPWTDEPTAGLELVETPLLKRWILVNV
ncbi:MAG: type II toxin-antitoxin system HicB family antitoxin [Planctomycetota bacterium]